MPGRNLLCFRIRLNKAKETERKEPFMVCNKRREANTRVL